MLKLRIRTKIFIILLGLSIISLFVYAYTAYIHMKRLGHYALESNVRLRNYAVNSSMKALKDDTEEYLLQIARDYAFIVGAAVEDGGIEISFVATYASGLWSNPSLYKHRRSYSLKERPEDIHSASVYFLAPGVSVDAVREELNISSNMDAIFKSIYTNDENLDCVYIGTESGIFRNYPWESGTPPSFDPRKRPWYKKAVETGDTVWSAPYIGVSGKEPIVTCSKPVYGPERELIGVVAMDVTLKTMNEGIKKAKVGELGYAFLIDNNGNVIARPELTAEDKRWDETFEAKNLLDSDIPGFRKIIEDMTARNTGITRCKLKSGEKYIAYAPLPYINWSLGIVLPIEEVIAPAKKTKDAIVSDAEIISNDINYRIKKLLKIFTFVFILVIFTVSLAAYKLSKKITRPILALDDGVKVVSRGNLDYHIEVKTGDEIEDLANAFNKMTNDLKIYMENLKETTAKNERIKRELKIARDIQASMLPRIFPPFPDRKEIDVYATMHPAREVGGDFYDFFFVDQKNLCFAIGDVSGKGVPAALFMAITKSLIKMVAMHGGSPEETLYKVNKILYPGNDACMFVTILCAMLNTETGQVHFANAGHNPPLVSVRGGDYKFTPIPHGTFVGAVEGVKIGTKELTLEPNDVIFMYTDGLTECMNQESHLFSEARLKQSLSNAKDKNIKDLVNALGMEIETFAQGVPQSDDITMLALKFNG